MILRFLFVSSQYLDRLLRCKDSKFPRRSREDYEWIRESVDLYFLPGNAYCVLFLRIASRV